MIAAVSPLLVLFAPVLALNQGDARAEEFRYEIEKLGWEQGELHQVPGTAVALVRAGKLAWVQGCGFADLESEREVTADTVFNIGSISKTVGAWGCMLLVERGKIDLDAPVMDVVKRWQLPPSSFDSKGVTLRRLLSHTAGLSLHGYPGFPPDAELPTLERSLSGDTNGAGDVHLAHAPGTKWQYSGGGYTLAQLLCEELTGESFAEFMRANVLIPLGMEHSAYGWPSELLAGSATPYDDRGEPLPRGGPRFPELAAAGFQTTAGDLALFACAGLTRFRGEDAPRVLKPETIELMQTGAPASPEWGLGYDVRDVGGLRLVGHGGANDGWMARLTLAPASGDAIVILTNGSNGFRVIDALEKAWVAFLQAGETKPAAGAAR